MTWNLNEVARNRSQQKFNESSLSLCQYHMRELRASCFLQVLDINGIIMVPQSHNMGDCELSLDPIDCKSTVCPQKGFLPGCGHTVVLPLYSRLVRMERKFM